MYYAILCEDVPNSLPLRMQARIQMRCAHASLIW